VQDRFLRASDFMGQLGQDIIADWKTVAVDELNGHIVPPCGSVGFRWGESGSLEYEQKPQTGTSTVAFKFNRLPKMGLPAWAFLILAALNILISRISTHDVRFNGAMFPLKDHPGGWVGKY